MHLKAQLIARLQHVHTYTHTQLCVVKPGRVVAERWLAFPLSSIPESQSQSSLRLSSTWVRGWGHREMCGFCHLELTSGAGQKQRRI